MSKNRGSPQDTESFDWTSLNDKANHLAFLRMQYSFWYGKEVDKKGFEWVVGFFKDRVAPYQDMRNHPDFDEMKKLFEQAEKLLAENKESDKIQRSPPPPLPVDGENKMQNREIKNCRSEIDKSRSITPDSCVLSLARKVDAGNRQHVFMVLEGITDGNRFAWYADLTMRGNQPPDNKFSRINIDEKDSKDFQKKLLPEIDKNALRDVSFAAQIWNIDKTDAMELKEAVRREKKEWEDSRRNVPYQILGNESKSAHSSSQDGHNCFTWAREKINKLKIDEVNVPVSLFDWVGTLPSYHIPDPRKNMNSFWTPQRVAVVGMVGIGVGVAASRCTIL